MPQSAQHSLTHVLLLWVTVLSISHMVFIGLFFTAGQRDPNRSVGAPPLNNATSSTWVSRPPVGKGNVLNFKFHSVNKTIKWTSRNEEPSLISEANGVLTIIKDGHYFLCLQVTLPSGTQNVCQGSQHRVSLKKDNKILLESQINGNTCSTGFMGKAVSLQGDNTLVVTVEPPVQNMNSSEAVTYLDVIYLFEL